MRRRRTLEPSPAPRMVDGGFALTACTSKTTPTRPRSSGPRSVSAHKTRCCSMRDVLYCDECGARLNLYVVGVCSRCHFDLTGEDEDERREVEAPPRVEGPAE